MSSRFSHLSREPKKFNLDLTPFLESEFLETDEYGNGYFYYTDNHSDEFLIPTMVVVLNYLANTPLTKDIYDYNYQHFWQSCLSYIEYFYRNKDFEHLDFFQKKYEIEDAILIFDKGNNKNNVIDFQIIVNNNMEKKSLIELFLYLYKYGIKEYNLNKKELNLSNESIINDFLNKFIQTKKEITKLAYENADKALKELFFGKKK